MLAEQSHPIVSVRLREHAGAGGFSVFAGVGERTREGNDLYKEMIESVSLNPVGGCSFVGQEEPSGLLSLTTQWPETLSAFPAGCYQAG